MFKEFSSIEDLVSFVAFDKQKGGALKYIANRYPVRFVLFDNFVDSYEFASQLQSKNNCAVKSIDEWLDSTSSDTFITHTSLAFHIKKYIKSHPEQDSIITPFSELARFYNNIDSIEFDSLISTVKEIESTQEGFDIGQRIYIPIVGLENKLSRFYKDSQINIWYFKNSNKLLTYRLILSENNYGIKGIEDEYTLVANLQEWLQVWKNKDVKTKIISISPALFANALYAQPDNSFALSVCHNVFEFLTKGLSLEFGSMAFNEKESDHWIRLAGIIDIKNFSFERFLNQYFHIFALSDYTVFLKTWFDCNNDFEKWLLVNYYKSKFPEKDYICIAIKNTVSLADYDFFSSIALSIFETEDSEGYLDERNTCLQHAAWKSIKLSRSTQDRLIENLICIANNPSKGFRTAIRYFSPITDAEKLLAIKWLRSGYINREDIKTFFPDLFNYLAKTVGTNDTTQIWILDYIDKYRYSKISNCCTEDIEQLINKLNWSDVAFNQWYQDFKTVKTILNNRTDIDIYYWIDGLGIDWIPYITNVIAEKEGIYINEIHIARVSYPTITDINKIPLEELANNNLKKIGDLDTHAHKNSNKYPDYIIEEIRIVNEAISKIIDDYSGKRIAIVSDHGLTSLAQFKSGLNLAGVKSDHGGRIAIREIGKALSDNNYLILPDGKTMCALRHDSLCGKIPEGQSAHGGCTPEEILVPIFIISSQRNTRSYTVTLITQKISGTNPVVEYEIKGLLGGDIPFVLYNGNRYSLSQQEDFKYLSERLKIVDGVEEIEIHIGDYFLKSKIILNLGVKEDDLFNL